ncbi:MAG: hypothetical protein AB1705_07455 [Verrucomicrobiota bacterium]
MATIKKLMVTALAAIIGFTCEGKDVRLAILAGQQDQPADLLTVALSSETGIALLERAEIERALREQSLSVGSKQGLIALGEVLGADGMLILEPAKAGTNDFLAVRLIAVRPGVVIGSFQSPLPMVESWAAETTKRLKGLFPKLEVSRAEALPISIVNLRAALASEKATAEERELTALLVRRLMAEPAVFVLERQRMAALTWEKALKAVDETPFWNGSHLLDGLIDKVGRDATNITIDVRMLPPGQQNALELSARGPRNQPVQVVNELVEKILTALQRQTASRSWNPEAEAQFFFEECEWALRWGLWTEAQRAAEAAWALGKRTEEAAQMRIASYIEATQTDAGWHFDSYRRRNISMNAPEPAKLAMALHGLALYADYLDQLSRPEARWLGLGLQSLTRSSDLLRHYRYRVRDQLGHEEQIRLLQAACAQLFQRLQRERPQLPAGRLEVAQLNYASFWHPTPELALPLYRELVLSGAYQHARLSLLLRDYPVLIAWRQEDRAEAARLWSHFTTELCTAESLTARVDGRLFRLKEARTDEELASGAQDVLDLVWDPASKSFAPSVSWDLAEAFEKLMEAKCNGFATAEKKRQKELQRGRQFALSKHFARTASSHSAKVFEALLPTRTYSVAESRELLPLVEGYYQRLSVPEAANFLNWLERYAQFSLEELKQYLAHAKSRDLRKLQSLFSRFLDEDAKDELRPLMESYRKRVGDPDGQVAALINTKLKSFRPPPQPPRPDPDQARAQRLAEIRKYLVTAST